MTVTNSGTAGATIGNIVVNLQSRSGNKWITRSSDIADATSGDAATTAWISPHASSENLSMFTENPASGQLLFMDANSNTMFSLVPQQIIAPGASVSLLFSASFDNNVLALPVGTPVRAEVIVSFGNSGGNANNSSVNLDINGNGVIDADESRIRSVPARLGLSVPTQTPGNAQVTLRDTLADITSTGTVTFSNPMFNLDAMGGTVTVAYSGGTEGGTITNCAHHLTSPDTTLTSGGFTFPTAGLDLQACNTQTIGAHVCTPGAPGCGWEPGDMMTFNQGQWGDETSGGGALLVTSFNAVYGGLLEVGLIGAAGFSMAFTFNTTVLAYLPATGPVGSLTGDLLNPTSSSSGLFSGEVVALQLNVDFSDADLLSGSAPSHIGDLRICNFIPLPVLNGQTIRQFLATANTLLGGGSATINISQATTVASFINAAFAGGNPSVFAQDNLIAGTCPPRVGSRATC